MAESSALFTNQTVNRTDINSGNDLVAGTVYEIASATVDNTPNGGSAFSKGRVNLTYSALNPASPGGGSYRLGCIVMQKDENGDWVSSGLSQFAPLTGRDSQSLERTLEMREDLVAIDTGIDDVVYPLDREVKRISRVSDRLPAAELRVCIILVDNDPSNTTSRFESVTINGDIERWANDS